MACREVKAVTPEEIISITKEYLAKQPDVAAAYVFGSVARDRMWAQSDVDVAVIFTAEAGGQAGPFRPAPRVGNGARRSGPQNRASGGL